MSKLVGGSKFRDDVLNLQITRKHIISDLLFERDVLLVTSDAGAGKSIFGTQMAISLTFKRPFLGFDIPEAKRVLYVQLEGDYEESIQRIRHMETEGGIIFEENNILWAEEKTLDVLDPNSVQGFFHRVNETKFIPEVTILDPIYKLSREDISTGKAMLGVINFSDLLMHKWGCSNVLIHHNLKETYGLNGKKINKDDAFYGHSFLKNHVRTSYAMKITGENNREFVRMKGRGSDTVKQFKVVYDHESNSLSLDPNTPKYHRGKHNDRLFAFLEESNKAGKTLVYKDIIEACNITYDQLRTLKTKDEFNNFYIIKKDVANNRDILYPKLP